MTQRRKKKEKRRRKGRRKETKEEELSWIAVVKKIEETINSYRLDQNDPLCH